MGWFHDGTGWWAVFGNLWNVFSWIVFIGLIVFVVTRVARHEPAGPRDHEKKDALEIAKERYARGEITKEEFEEVKKTLLAS